MNKHKHRLISAPSKFPLGVKKSLKKRFMLGSILATLIAGSPFLFYLYEYVPETAVWDTYFFTYHSGYYENAQTAMWMLTGKIIPLFFLIIWFFTCRHWWYHTLLVPIVMYSYQILSGIHQDLPELDQFNLIVMLPIMALVIPSIYLIRARIFNRINDVDKTMQDLEEEFKIKPKGLMGNLKEYF